MFDWLIINLGFTALVAVAGLWYLHKHKHDAKTDIDELEDSDNWGKK